MWEERPAGSCSHLSGGGVVFSGGGVSYESEVRDKEKHSLGTQELLLLCKEAGKHLSNMSYYAFHFTRSLHGHEAIAVFHNFL